MADESSQPAHDAVKGWQQDGTYVPCAACGWQPPAERRRLPGTPVRMPGVTHFADCPTVQFMTPAQKQALRDHLIEMDSRRRKGAASAGQFLIW